jgi:hypothetical protein
MRYSFSPNEVDPMWGIELNLTDQNEHVLWWSSRRVDGNTQRGLFGMVLGLGGVPLDD